MICIYTSHINSLMLVTFRLKQVAAIYNCYSEAVHWQSTFQPLLFILGAQLEYHTLKNMT
jgi:hypothetical protein